MLSNGRKRSRISQDALDTYRFGGEFDDQVFCDQDNSLFMLLDKNSHLIPFPSDDPHLVNEFLKEEFDKELQTHVETQTSNDLGNGVSCIGADRSQTPFLNTSSNTSPNDSPFETFIKQESVTSGDNEKSYEQQRKQPSSVICANTVATLKRSIAGSSRLIGTFTALKTTYLKLCKEFNFLLGKFNENERIKIELIHENNELRKLLWDAIKDREMDRKQYKAQLAQLEKNQ